MVNGDYNKEVLSEEGFIVELSNEGELKKHNPNFYNPQRISLKCVSPGCEKMTKATYGTCGKHPKLSDYPLHTKDWLGRTIPPEKSREDCKTFALPHSQISGLLIDWIANDSEKGKKVDLFVKDILKEFHGKIPNASLMQEINLGKKVKSAIGPEDSIEISRKLLEKHFSLKEYGKVRLEGGKFKGIEMKNIPLRVVLLNLILAFVCEESNRGDSFSAKQAGLEPRYANMFMPLAIYLLRREGATDKEAKMSVRG